MFYLFHGDDLSSSRKALNDLKASGKYQEVLIFDGDKIDETNLKQAVEADSLFLQKRLIVLENFLSSKQFQTFLKIISQNQNHDIAFWENKELKKTSLSKFPFPLQINVYKQSPILFKFLENFAPSNLIPTLRLYRELSQKENPSLIFYVFAKHLRNLILVKEKKPNKTLPLQNWQITKLTKQAKYFTMEKLLVMYKDLLKIDISVKTGSSPFSLSRQFELYIISHLSQK